MLGNVGSRLRSIWERLWLVREDGITLAALRIVLVSVFLITLCGHLGTLGEHYSSASWFSTAQAQRAFAPRWSIFWLADDPGVVRLVVMVGIVAHVAWIVGWRTRVAAFVAWVVWVSLMGRNPWLYALPDQLLLVLCTWLMLMPTGRAGSLDARAGRGGTVPVGCRRLLQCQVAVVYAVSGGLKTGVAWREEWTALYYALTHPYNGYLEISRWLAWLQPWVLGPATVFVLLWEITFALFVGLLWWREAGPQGRRIPDLRPVYLGSGVVMHGCIALFLYVGVFTPLILGVYLAFIHPDEARAWWARRGPSWRPKKLVH